jgi:hypothetical protein
MGTKLLHPMLRRVVDAGVMSEAQAVALVAAPTEKLTRADRADQIIAELMSDARKASATPRVDLATPEKAYSAEERADILAQLSPSMNPTVLARTHGIPLTRILRWARDAGIKLVDGRTRSGQWKRSAEVKA